MDDLQLVAVRDGKGRPLAHRGDPIVIGAELGELSPWRIKHLVQEHRKFDDLEEIGYIRTYYLQY